MKIKTTIIPNRDLEDILIQAFRYCLPRRTGVSAECVDRLAAYWSIINPEFQKQIQGDIRWQKERGQLDREDIAEWDKILVLEVSA